MKIPELLVPVGGPQQLRAAIANGADAVYMSGNAFNARLNADNFSDNEIANAIDLAHEYGVRVHITQNTLIKTEEMEAALNNAIKMYEYGADALIIQDRGLASAIKKIIPDMPLHMSTQGTVYDIEGVREAVNAGFDRVILSRELSRDEIADICRAAKRELDTEIEIFVHGAICICYSGQCHMSDFIGGRSGNRGACAQPCRLPYSLLLNGRDTGAANYPLSPADMSLIKHLRDISEMGVASLKIEGRMKSPEYVALVASKYRKYLDSIALGDEKEVTKQDIDELMQIFSRGKFTDAYFMGESGKQLMSDDLPKHHGLKIGELVSADRKRGHAFIKLSSELSNGDGIEIRSTGSTAKNKKQAALSAGGVITYIKQAGAGQNNKNKKSRASGNSKAAPALLKKAERGQTVEAGDIPALAKADASVLHPGTPVYRISDASLNACARASYEKLPQRVGVDLRFKAAEGERALLTASEHAAVSEGECVKVMSDAPLEKAIKKPADEESIKQRLHKTGGTPYKTDECEVCIKGEPVISAAELNAMRREALEKLTEKRLERSHRRCAHGARRIKEILKIYSDMEYTPEGNKESENKKTEITLNVYMTDSSVQRASQRVINIIKALQKDEISVPDMQRIRLNIPFRAAMDENVIKAAAAAGVQLTACLPAISKKAYSGGPVISSEDTDHLKELCTSGAIYGISIANPSQLMLFGSSAAGGEQETRRIFFEESMNIYNAYTAARALARGMIRGVVSHELDPSDMTSFGKTASACEFSVWGRIPLMYTEHCPAGSSPVAGGVASSKGHSHRNDMCCCSEEDKKHYCRAGRYELADRKGERFPLVLDDSTCRCTVMSFRKADHTHRINELKSAGINCFRINIFDEDTDEIMDILKYVR